ncbi:hypothetical protein RUM43_006773 [Polyplax serrata]|uniref:Nucleoporin NUP53 n=1 Tax=Polyplax serrata TaxID=468196 RepID=A0AAN8SA22_POLSC
MEPMNIGTPNNSAPSSPATTPTGSPYLPAFLLGEPQTPISGSTSPRAKRVPFNESHSTSKDHAKHDHSNTNYFLSQIVNSPGSFNSSMQYSTTEKSNGPPILGLFDTINSPPLGNDSQSNNVQQYVSFASKQYADSRTSPIKSLDVTENNWVTVFGYPPSASSFILSQLSHCGNIIATRSPAKGNWMHIQYSSKLEARRALTNNGKVFASTVMIGVVPCKDQGVLAEASANRDINTSMSFQATSPSSCNRSRLYPDLNGSKCGTPCTDTSNYESIISSPTRHINARPLQSRVGDTEVYSSGNTPQKNTGLVAKAMEYVFGW